MALLKKDSVRARIMDTELFNSGKPFYPRDMSRLLGLESNQITAALCAMVSAARVIRMDDDRYVKPIRHWIHKIKWVPDAED